MLTFLLALQIFQVAFLLLHDWVPLGSLNRPAATRVEHSPLRVAITSVLMTLPYAIALRDSVHYFHAVYPHWLWTFLWVAYGILFLGELNAWWIPYFRGAEPKRVTSYERMFGATHAFLPSRNGIRINTLHVMLHSTTLLTLITLATLTI